MNESFSNHAATSFGLPSGTFPVTRSAALARFEEFLRDDLRAYAGRRNRVEPDLEHPGVSRLSAALRRRTIDEDELTRATLDANSSWSVVEKWLQELWWRRYWKGWLEHRPEIWRHWCASVRWGLADQAAKAELPSGLRQRIEQVEQGRSGVAVMDAMADELRSTGYLHNHARMWFASFWIHVENLPWWWGARFFMRHLIDADPASNTLSWRWVAGHQTAGKTYLVRRSNLQRWCDPDWLDRHSDGLDRLDDHCVTARLQCEWPDRLELEPAPCPTGPEGTLQSWLDRNADLTKQCVLLLHPDESNAETGPLGRMEWAAVVSLCDQPDPAIHAADSPAALASQIAMEDTWQRTLGHWAAKARRLSDGSMLDLTAQLIGLVRDTGSTRVVTPFAFTGPVADQLACIREAVAAQGINWVALQRESDAFAIQAARRGFFPFWKTVSDRLKT